MILLYNLAIQLYVFVIRLSAVTGNQKAKHWINGRHDWRNRLRKTLKAGERRIWFHCSSLGEFEQGRPLMEKFKVMHPEFKIVLTFFSPSGYEIRKNYAGADYVFYMPADTRANASDFISIVNPELVFFTKYEYWHHYFHQLKQREISLYMISALFRSGDRFFKWWGGFFRNMLRCVTRFFVQDLQSAELLKQAGFTNVLVAGDTRFDRVVEVAKEAGEIEKARRFSAGHKVLVAGSTWPEDEKIIAEAMVKRVPDFRLIVAPHEVNESRIEGFLKIFSGFRVCRFSTADEQAIDSCEVLLIDNIGMLSSLYRYGAIAYLGGGFGKGIHNTLEAAVYGVPVLFGPNFGKFNEAKELIACGGAFSVKSSEALKFQMDKLLSDSSLRDQAGNAAGGYVMSHSGATQGIMAMVFSNKV